MKAANPLYVPTDISRAPKPRTDRPARQQITEEPKEATDNVVGEYNIWYHRHLGYDAKTAKATTRLDVDQDTGMTTANLFSSPVCLNFARGNCMRGHRCHWKHQVPTEDDELRVSLLKDVFGRTRHGTDKEDMDGVGNFTVNNRTLYIGGVVSSDDVRDTERIIREEFQKFGEIEYVRVIPSKAIAFVRFKLRVAAEFAREAMNGQSAKYGEILNLKWAKVDPNPLAKEFDRRADEALTAYALAKKIMQMPEEKKKAWRQMQMVGDGVYPGEEEAPEFPATIPEVPATPAVAINSIPEVPGIDPARAQQFAEYWAAFHAKKTADELGIAPPPQVTKFAEKKTVPEVPEAPEVLTNPHTGETVEKKFAVNPYSQAPHPYAYRDYGWNRPKKKEKKGEREEEREKKNAKRSAAEVLAGERDVNFSYGPAMGNDRSGDRMENDRKKRQNSGAEDSVRVGRPRAEVFSAPVTLLPAPAQKGKKKIVASRAEEEALANDEPLAFGE